MRRFSFIKFIKPLSENTFPVVLFSSPLKKLWEETPHLPTSPIPPKKPQFIKSLSSLSVWLLVLFGANIIIVIGASISEGVMEQEILYYLLSCLFMIGIILVIGHINYQGRIKEYESEMRNYQYLLNAHKQKVDSLLSEENLRAYRKGLINKWLGERQRGVTKIPEFRYCSVSDDRRIGKSEKAFFNRVRASMPYNVRDDLKVPFGYGYYYPDIAIIAEGLFIDVEIDEPYSDEDGQPIHYVENLSGTSYSVDERRNSFMLNEGWEVIRFAEEQIVKHPQTCIDFINSVVSALLTDNGSKPTSLTFNYQVNKWTKAQAEYFALEKYRDSYTLS